VRPAMRLGSLLFALAMGSAHALAQSEQHRHEQLTAMQAAFSRFGSQGAGGALARQDVPNFLRYVVSTMNSVELPQNEFIARSSELTRQLVEYLPPQATQLTLADVVRAADKIIIPPPASQDGDLDKHAHGRQGSKQLRLMRKNLERNRLTMPLFDTKGWVRDFEKALKIQWEIYANGLAPMHIVVGRSDRIYGLEVVTGQLE